MTKPLLPHDENTEKSILTTIAWNAKLVPDALIYLKEEYFYSSDAQKIFSIMRAIADEALVDISPISVTQSNIALGVGVNQSSIVDYVYDINLYNLHTQESLLYNIKKLIELWHRRVAIVNLTSAINESHDLTTPIKDIAGLCEAVSISLTSDTTSRKKTDVKSLVEEARDRIVDAHNPDTENKIGIQTGYEEYDIATNGLKKDELILIAARPGVGKTALAINILSNIWKSQPKVNTLFFSLEMSSNQILDRLISLRSGLPMSEITQGRITKNSQIVDLSDGIKGLMASMGNIVDDCGVDCSWIRSKIRSFNLKKKVDIVIIDYVQLIRPDDWRMDRQSQVSKISSAIKTMAKQFEIPIIAVAQLNRDPEKRKDGVPKISDLRESGQLEADADTIGLLWYPDSGDEHQTNRKRIMKLALAKNRHGPEGEITLLADLSNMSITQE